MILATDGEKVGYSSYSSLGLYYYGKNRSNTILQNAGLALGQAAILGVTISSLYKSVTGRHGPNILRTAAGEDASADYSHDFKFGFMRNGNFQGWPSGHATVAFAMGATLAELYPENDWIRYGSYAYSMFIAVGISTNIHWLSDGIAGSLIGYAVGKNLGQSFRKKQQASRERSVAWLVGPGNFGVRYTF